MLTGIRIIEIEALGPAPFAGMMLADLGAEVICIHRKGGTATPGLPEHSILDRGKKSIALDLKDPEDVAITHQLIATADGLIEGFRPGVMERLGLGPDEMQARNPGLVYGRMTGWGQDSPRAARAGHDLNYIALSGALWPASAPGDVPLPPATLVGDIGGGALYLVAGLLTGLLRAARTGVGAVVDAAIYDGSAHMMNLLMALRQAGGFGETRGHNLLDGPHWSRTYLCRGGGHIAVQCLEPKFYRIFLETLGLSEDPEFTRQFDRSLWPELTARLAGRFAEHSRDHWAALFEDSDACVTPVLSPAEAAAAPMNTRKTWINRDGDLQAAPAPRFDGKTQPVGALPRRDGNRAEILAALAASATHKTGPEGA
ncbi:CoA transferase [Epibacterium sp. MM17-32]|uniref:CaiB/BaiF CoA transferase family protein n=1 Tax=Epibacterium sp. MM17-32 TaxID=2917734 RepID=UPI001EF601CA|nr:CaiB/BaiF CoA-transferase family protein [Epibacterium sp. MM17-32]MCG7627101.1 CoA transferase [Epibacterium sp. MM17-32]